MTPAASSRGEQTRDAIAAAARSSFLERGYEATTMRLVAERAGVSLGNAYYYFASKDHLVQAFYNQLQVDHAEAARRAMTGHQRFARRMTAALLTWVDIARPLHPFAGSLFRVAAEPTGPLSPFSTESATARNAGIGLFRAVLEGSDLRLSAELRAELPELLWLVHMGVVLFWVHDRSESQRRTRALIRRACPLLERLLGLTRVPVARSIASDVVALVRSVRA